MTSGASSATLFMIIIACVVVLAGLGAWYGFTLHRKKKVLLEQARRVADRQDRRQKRKDARQRTRQEEVSAVRNARANGDRRPVVLVVDDSPTALEAARRLLEDHRYRVVTATHGKDAWSALQDLHPDLILTDIEMPHLDGFGLLRMVRADLALADVPVVFMTANPVHHIRAGKQTGVDGFVVKPYKEEDLIGQIQYLLQE